jgi:hypothetical protein
VKVLQNSGETGCNLLVTQTLEQGRLSPSMRRPVDVKAHFCFLFLSFFAFFFLRAFPTEKFRARIV